MTELLTLRLSQATLWRNLISNLEAQLLRIYIFATFYLFYIA